MKKHIRNFLLLTTFTTASMHLINRFIQASSTIKNILKTDYGKFFDWKYGKIFYTKRGKGSPVVLIHDLDPASSSLEWEKISKSLSKGHTVYTLDLLGCGRSDKPKLTYTNYLYVQLISDFIKEIIGEKADLISTGGSGSFSIMACNMNPEHFNKIILINPDNLQKLAQTPDKRKNILKTLIELPILGTFIYNVLYSHIGITQLFTGNSLSINDKNTLDSYYEAAHLGDGNGKYLFSSIYSDYTNINIVHALKNIDHRIYLIYGKEIEYAQEIVASYTDYNASIESAFVKNSKYLPQIENPSDLLNQLELFLDAF